MKIDVSEMFILRTTGETPLAQLNHEKQLLDFCKDAHKNRNTQRI